MFFLPFLIFSLEILATKIRFLLQETGAHRRNFHSFVSLPFLGLHQSSISPDRGEEWQERTVFVILFQLVSEFAFCIFFCDNLTNRKKTERPKSRAGLRVGEIRLEKSVFPQNFSGFFVENLFLLSKLFVFLTIAEHRAVFFCVLVDVGSYDGSMTQKPKKKSRLFPAIFAFKFLTQTNSRTKIEKRQKKASKTKLRSTVNDVNG